MANPDLHEMYRTEENGVEVGVERFVTNAATGLDSSGSDITRVTDSYNYNEFINRDNIRRKQNYIDSRHTPNVGNKSQISYEETEQLFHENTASIIDYINNISNGVKELTRALKETVGVSLNTIEDEFNIQSVNDIFEGNCITQFANDTVLNREMVDGSLEPAQANGTNLIAYINSCIDNIMSYISISNGKIVDALNQMSNTMYGSDVITSQEVAGYNVIDTLEARPSLSNNDFTNNGAAYDIGSGADNLYQYVRNADKNLFSQVATSEEATDIGDTLFITEEFEG